MTKTLHSWHLSIAHADMLSDCSKEHMLLSLVFTPTIHIRCKKMQVLTLNWLLFKSASETGKSLQENFVASYAFL